jgi:hypothetical protein
VQRARKVIDKGAPELVAAVQAGDIPVKVAAAVVERAKDVRRQQTKKEPLPQTQAEARAEVRSQPLAETKATKPAAVQMHATTTANVLMAPFTASRVPRREEQRRH